MEKNNLTTQSTILVVIVGKKTCFSAKQCFFSGKHPRKALEKLV